MFSAEGVFDVSFVPADVWKSCIGPHLPVRDKVALGRCNKQLSDHFTRDARVLRWKRWKPMPAQMCVFEAAFWGDEPFVTQVAFPKMSKERTATQRSKRRRIRNTTMINNCVMTRGFSRFGAAGACLGQRPNVLKFFLKYPMYNYLTLFCIVDKLGADAMMMLLCQDMGVHAVPMARSALMEPSSNDIDMHGLGSVYEMACGIGSLDIIRVLLGNWEHETKHLEYAGFCAKCMGHAKLVEYVQGLWSKKRKRNHGI